MYLLMLLATYMSAIYGYNLSIRPDYDRDVAHKKAAAVAFRFVHQHNAVRNLLVSLQSGNIPGMAWVQPDDLIYAKDSNEENEKNVVFEYRQGTDTVDVPVRKKGLMGEDIAGGENVLRPGRFLYSSDMMVSKILCPDKEIDETDVNPKCTSPEDAGAVTGTCCGENATAYLVSYRKLDARWLNRLTNSVSPDFMWTFSKESYRSNMGVVTWSEHSKAWEFVGKIRMIPVYRKDREKYLEDHKGAVDVAYPTALMNRTSWTMPKKVFTKDFFTDATGKNKNFCEHGCLLKIQML